MADCNNPRRLLTHSMYNMRELGGYPAKNGAVTRYRRFIRSDEPTMLSEADIIFLKNYGVKLVIDMRMDFEAAERPYPLKEASGIRCLHIPLAHIYGLLGESFNPGIHYIEMLKGKNRAAEILSEISEMGDNGGAVLFHCSAGKDRTGIIAMLLLMLAGTPVEDIAADYSISFAYLKNRFFTKFSGVSLEEARFRSDESWAEPVCKYVESMGGIEPFLQGIGLSGMQIERLGRMLLED